MQRRLWSPPPPLLPPHSPPSRLPWDRSGEIRIAHLQQNRRAGAYGKRAADRPDDEAWTTPLAALLMSMAKRNWW